MTDGHLLEHSLRHLKIILIKRRVASRILINEPWLMTTAIVQNYRMFDDPVQRPLAKADRLIGLAFAGIKIIKLIGHRFDIFTV